jgi:hypothetical protein
MKKILLIFALALSPNALVAIENDEAIYLTCEHGKVKESGFIGVGKFKPGKHTLDKLLKNEVKLKSIKYLRSLRCWSNPCREVSDELWSLGMEGLKYYLFKINDETSLGKAKVCRTLLHSIQKENDKEVCETWDSDAGEIRKDKMSSWASSSTIHWILNRTTLRYHYSYYDPPYSSQRDDYQCYLSSAEGLEQVRNKFEEAKSPIYQALNEREEKENLETKRIKKNRKM